MIRERILFELSPPRSFNVEDGMCSTATIENWLEIFSTYMEIYSLDVAVNMEAELNELKHFRNVLFNC